MSDETQVIEPTLEEPSQEKYTEKEKAEFNLRKRADEAKAAGLDPAEVLGIKPELKVDPTLDDEKPLTIKNLRDLQKQDARQTALQMAQAIADPMERQSVIEELSYIVPSGNAEADFRRAQASANAERNAIIAREAGKRGEPVRTATGGGSPAQHEEEFQPTAEEAALWRGFGLSPDKMKEKILAARKEAEEKGLV